MWYWRYLVKQWGVVMASIFVFAYLIAGIAIILGVRINLENHDASNVILLGGIGFVWALFAFLSVDEDDNQTSN